MATASPCGSGRSRSRESPSPEAQAAQGGAGQQYPQWIDAGREYQTIGLVIAGGYVMARAASAGWHSALVTTAAVALPDVLHGRTAWDRFRDAPWQRIVRLGLAPLLAHPRQSRKLSRRDLSRRGCRYNTINRRSPNVSYQRRLGAQPRTTDRRRLRGLCPHQHVTRYRRKVDFTDVNQSISRGLSLRGSRWGRPDDTVGFSRRSHRISHQGKLYVAAGGLGPNAGPEQILETITAWPCSISPSSRSTTTGNAVRYRFSPCSCT